MWLVVLLHSIMWLLYLIWAHANRLCVKLVVCMECLFIQITVHVLLYDFIKHWMSIVQSVIYCIPGWDLVCRPLKLGGCDFNIHTAICRDSFIVVSKVWSHSQINDYNILTRVIVCWCHKRGSSVFPQIEIIVWKLSWSYWL